MFKAVYHKLSRELETYFSSGNFSGRLPGVLPLCRHFKTSKNTMSKALHILQKRGIIRIEGTRGMFFNGGSHYQVRYKVIGICGLILQEKLIQLLNEKFKHTGFTLVGLDIPYSINTKLLNNWFLQMPIDGIILLNSASTPELLDFFYENNIPVIGSTLPGYEHIRGYEPDHYQTYSRILKILKQKGHKRIALARFKTQKNFEFYFELIIKAFKDVLQDDFNESLIYAPEEYEKYLAHCPKDDSFSRFGQESCRYFLSLPEPPTAIIAEQPILFHIKATAEKEFQLKLPEDLSLFSIQYYFQRDPFYATALVRDDVAAASAVSTMIDMLNGKDVVPQHVFVPMTFKDGQSIAEYRQK
jgi:DNA-binding LacI/PurR family transcriptional regulator